ncbi:ribosome recycling factor [Algoriphagus sp. NF]|jgi:ribosome recycling factor|uniref:Ribosome-recycling factor n=3 Tax=Algoriphagus TaxID=246875 RepID=A0ABS7NAJ6_9BACT|nr:MULTISPECIES: ribosome recycling factor [Algoriphagus]KPQ10010.1 MAG: ribosome recycling factor Frr [Algoriphagus marincola HL-49]MCR9081179.1 ribosome recycling factor [Cyclobacteriaceae bacterium]MBY5952250.1 ribosome recycling factor [Algoriphagus marincola]MDE0559907.1 ribosome recycling factor [Algoriphagus sp. NF]TDK44681.1 ribosome recycling factor [Algoriphagus aquimaris]
MEEIELYLEEAKELMQKAVDHTAAELVKIRAGKAMPNLLDGVMVPYYGTPTPINQVSSVTTPDARTLSIRPFEKNLISEIEKAIINSDLGLAPQNNGEVVILTIPTLTEERRLALVKQAKHECENGKISIRTVRKDTNDSLKKLQKEGASEDEVKRAEDKVQKFTDQYSAKIDELLVKKEADIMKV